MEGWVSVSEKRRFAEESTTGRIGRGLIGAIRGEGDLNAGDVSGRSAEKGIGEVGAANEKLLVVVVFRVSLEIPCLTCHCRHLS